jgi:predicted transcriptional regulator
MDPDTLSEVLSSKARLRIEDAISRRPRTLNELASITGISVQGVLRHMDRLMELGLSEVKRIVPSTPKARKVYVAGQTIIGDYSTGDLTIVKSTEREPDQLRAGRVDFERMAGELLIQRRRIREEARKLGRLIDELVSEQDALSSALDQVPLAKRERLILEVLLTEETVEDGVEVLSRYYGLNGRIPIESALAKAKRIVGK